MNKHKFLSIFPIIPALFCVSCNTHTKSNVEDYFDIMKECRENPDFHSQLYLFPKTIEGKEIKKFFYQETTDIMTGCYFFYLSLSYSEEDFVLEVNRMKEVKAEFKNGATKSVLSYPTQSAFLTISRDNRYEYALYNEEKLEITFISNQLYPWSDLLILEEQHKMPEFVIPKEYDDGNNSYNMYYFFVDGVGYEVTDNF